VSVFIISRESVRTRVHDIVMATRSSDDARGRLYHYCLQMSNEAAHDMFSLLEERRTHHNAVFPAVANHTADNHAGDTAADVPAMHSFFTQGSRVGKAPAVDPTDTVSTAGVPAMHSFFTQSSRAGKAPAVYPTVGVGVVADSIIPTDSVSSCSQAAALIVGEVPTAPLASPTTMQGAAVPEPSSGNTSGVKRKIDQDEYADSNEGNVRMLHKHPKRKTLDTYVKVRIINDMRKGMSKDELACKYGVIKKYIQKILCDETRVQGQFYEELRIIQLRANGVSDNELKNIQWTYLGLRNERHTSEHSLKKISTFEVELKETAFMEFMSLQRDKYPDASRA
jgi:hypothetical protein